MREKGSLVRLFAEVSEDGKEINYFKKSRGGPKVVPRRFYPSRLVKLVKNKNKESEEEYVPDSFELVWKAPEDERINAYLLGDESYFGVTINSSIVQANIGPNQRTTLEGGQYFGDDGDKSRLVCVSYCSLSQRDLKKK